MNRVHTLLYPKMLLPESNYFEINIAVENQSNLILFIFIKFKFEYKIRF